MFQWFLTHIFSPLLLPVFILIVLCSIADVKAEGVIKLVFDLTISVLELIVRLLLEVLKLIGRVLDICVKSLQGKFCSIESGDAKKKSTGKTGKSGSNGKSSSDKQSSDKPSSDKEKEAAII